MIIAAEWVMFIMFHFKLFFDIDFDFLETHKYWSLAVIMLLGGLIYYLFENKSKSARNDFLRELSKVEDWKSSKYRKRALAYTVFYFVLFVPFGVGYFYVLYQLFG